jgi:hypothetical protein
MGAVAHRIAAVTVAVSGSTAIVSCSDDDHSATPALSTGAVIDPGDGGEYAPDVEPSEFTTTIDNPYFPLRPGTRWRYEETTEDGEHETIEVEVLTERRVVMGVETVVVHDVVRDDDGHVVEDTYDWFAQDVDGNVWYLGEDTTSYDDPSDPSSEGSWEAGVGGALPGIAMPGSPEISDTGYRQEYLRGEAEDMGQVIAVGQAVTTPAGTFDDVVVTRDWTPLEPGLIEEKVYAAGIGVVREETVEGGGDVVELVQFSG